MERYSSLFLMFFHRLVSMQAHPCDLDTLNTIPTSLLVFVGNVITSLIVSVVQVNIAPVTWELEANGCITPNMHRASYICQYSDYSYSHHRAKCAIQNRVSSTQQSELFMPEGTLHLASHGRVPLHYTFPTTANQICLPFLW